MENGGNRGKQRRGTVHDIISPQLIKKVTGEYDLEVVQWLNLSGNGIRVMENLLSCTNLQELDLSHNQIRDIEGLDTMMRLQKLDLSSNRIQRIEHLDHLESLEELQLQGNQITSVDDVLSLQNLPKLKHFYLKNYDGSKKNPACDHPSYMTIVLRYLRHITVLDGESTHLQKYMADWEKMLESLRPDDDANRTPPVERWFDEVDARAGGPEEEGGGARAGFLHCARDLTELLHDVDDLCEDATALVSEKQREIKRLMQQQQQGGETTK